MSMLSAFLLMSVMAFGIDAATLKDVGNHVIKSELRPYIVGGEEATKNEFPWIVRLYISIGSQTYLCSGTLIEMGTVLTAAHCVDGAIAGNIEVTAGDHDRALRESTEQIGTGASIRIHEDYDSNQRGELNDIALIRLSNEFNLTTSVSPINLPPSDSATSSNGIVAGWGTTSYDGEISNVLMKVSIPIVASSSVNCTLQVRDRNTQICAGQPGKDSCQGDSGGPLICKNSASDPYEICGIVSYGYECARLGFPGVYTKVSSYISWIGNNTSEWSTQQHQ